MATSWFPPQAPDVFAAGRVKDRTAVFQSNSSKTVWLEITAGPRCTDPWELDQLEAGITGILFPASEGAEIDKGEQFLGRARQAFIVNQAEEGPPIGGVCRNAGSSQVAIYAWRKTYAGLLPQRYAPAEDVAR